jgi:putative transcriptional regulator
MVKKQKELVKHDMSLDVSAEILQSNLDIKAVHTKVIGNSNVDEVIKARTSTGLSQSAFATLIGVSVRTLQDWEQGRRKPSGAVKTLLQIAQRRPEVLVEIAQ